MEKSRLLTIFNTFSKKELRDLRKWLLSPAHNQREDVVQLFEYLVENTDSANPESVHRELIFQTLFPGETFDDARLRQTAHFLLKSIEEFFIYQELRSDEVRSLTALARVYRKRNLDKPFQAAMTAARNAHQNHPYRNERFQRDEFLIQLEEYAFVESKKRTVKMNLQEVVNALDVTYLSDKLRYSCMVLAHQTVYKTDYEIGMLREVLDYVEKSNFFDVPAIAVYYFGYKTNVEKENPEHYQMLKKYILQYEQFFPPSELRDIYLLAINYCINRLNAGKSEFGRETFEMYKKGLENAVLFENNLLSRFTFMNVATLGLQLKEFNWVEKFIVRFKDHLEEKVRDNIVHFSTANLAFEKKDYTTAMQLLTQVEFDDILMNLNSKRMLLKMFYEENELDALESLLESLRNYIQRKKVMGYHKANFTNLIRLTKKLIKVNPYNKNTLGTLKAEIQEAKPLAAAEKNWLLEQLENI